MRMLMNKTDSTGRKQGLVEILMLHANCKGHSEPGRQGDRLVLKPVTSGSSTANPTAAAETVFLGLIHQETRKSKT